MPELARAAIALPIIFAVAGLLLLVHELGHYVAARACRRPVRLVAIGFGPKLIEWIDRQAPAGASPSSRSAATSRYARGTTPADHPSFRAGPVVVRLVVTAAGPAANLILAVILYAGLAGATGEIAFLTSRQLHRTREPGRDCRFPARRSDHRRPTASRRPLRRSPPHPGKPPEPCRPLRGYPESRDAGADRHPRAARPGRPHHRPSRDLEP